jgi:hypothetical protein
MNPVKLAEYQIWADGVIVRLLRELSQEEFDRDVLPPYGSIRLLTGRSEVRVFPGAPPLNHK